MAVYKRAFLKWPGGKYRILNHILEALPKGQVLMEPFVGGGSVFLNTNFEHYILNDINRDLITLYKTIQQQGKQFIEQAEKFFVKKYNNEKSYYKLRSAFNESTDALEKSILFVYLNRHGYNGLCRYNLYKGEFNVPFGFYVKPYFPEEELYFFYEKSKKARFFSENFTKILTKAKRGVVVYADPPYAPLNKTACFTAYHGSRFDLDKQIQLESCLRDLKKRGIPALISNHSTVFTKHLYQGAQVREFLAPRLISCNSKNRKAVLELLAIYHP